MAKNGEVLTPKQKRMIAALLAAPTIGAACTTAGVSRTTLARWLLQPEFTEALHVAESEAISEAARGLLGDLIKNHETLRKIRDDSDPYTVIPAVLRMRAAVELDAAALRWRQAGDLEKRLVALEEAAKNAKP